MEVNGGYLDWPATFCAPALTIGQNGRNAGGMIIELQRTVAELQQERDAALAREAALSEVLDVINQSPGDTAPVFATILDQAHRLCDAAMGSLGTFDGELFRAVATHGFPEQFANQLHQPFRPHRYMRPLVDGARLVVEPDIQALISDDHAIHGAVEAGARTTLVVPLRKAGALVGYISAFRREVRPFSGTEITLLETFAAQAVIAMENARLLQELSEALDEQTATAEILQVINASQGDLTPVFVAMIDKTQRLTQSEFSSLMIYDGSLFHLFSGNEWQPDTLSPEPGAALAELLEGVPFVHIPDVVDTDAYRARIPSRVLLVEGFGARTTLSGTAA